MTFDQGVDWALRILMVILTFWVFLWGKSAKQAEALLAAQLQIRDNKLEEIIRRLERAGQQSSDLTDKVQVLVSRDEFQKEHRFRSDQNQVLNANFGTLQLAQAKLEERVRANGDTLAEHAKILGDFRLGRREYDPT